MARFALTSPSCFATRRKILAGAGPTWTRELLCLQMRGDGWATVAVCTMGRALARLGARLGLPKPVVLCPWPRDARAAVLQQIRALEGRASAQEPVLYSDEVDIHLNPKIGRDWMLPGHQRRIVTPGKNEKFYIAGALDVRTGKLHTTGAARKNTDLFCVLLWLLARSYGRHVRRIHLIVDNYGIHSARKTKRALEALGGRIVLHFLPPYCPDANRIERVWQDLHANVTRNHRCKTMRSSSTMPDNTSTTMPGDMPLVFRLLSGSQRDLVRGFCSLILAGSRRVTPNVGSRAHLAASSVKNCAMCTLYPGLLIMKCRCAG
ncbi:IS630 family transposase [Pendulispora rubella]|uniref:IS630 family transposase n=1 Tax=Pendulispora rubella TaxID=2741070 RepID=A0ABZ2LDW3_9BACT